MPALRSCRGCGWRMMRPMPGYGAEPDPTRRHYCRTCDPSGRLELRTEAVRLENKNVDLAGEGIE